MIGQQVIFVLNIPYIGIKTGAGTVKSKGDFAILGETYKVISDGTGDYARGVAVEVKRSSMTVK